MTAIDGVSFDECFDARVEVVVAGTTLPVISIEHLIRNKLATGRSKDKADVESLRDHPLQNS